MCSEIGLTWHTSLCPPIRAHLRALSCGGSQNMRFDLVASKVNPTGGKPQDQRTIICQEQSYVLTILLHSTFTISFIFQQKYAGPKKNPLRHVIRVKSYQTKRCQNAPRAVSLKISPTSKQKHVQIPLCRSKIQIV